MHTWGTDATSVVDPCQGTRNNEGWSHRLGRWVLVTSRVSSRQGSPRHYVQTVGVMTWCCTCSTSPFAPLQEVVLAPGDRATRPRPPRSCDVSFQQNGSFPLSCSLHLSAVLGKFFFPGVSFRGTCTRIVGEIINDFMRSFFVHFFYIIKIYQLKSPSLKL